MIVLLLCRNYLALTTWQKIFERHIGLYCSSISRNSEYVLPKNVCFVFRIAILDIGSSHTYRPGDHMNGHTRLKQKLLKARGFTVVVMLQSAIFRHPQEEKVLYVKRELINAGVVFR